MNRRLGKEGRLFLKSRPAKPHEIVMRVGVETSGIQSKKDMLSLLAPHVSHLTFTEHSNAADSF